MLSIFILLILTICGFLSDKIFKFKFGKGAGILFLNLLLIECLLFGYFIFLTYKGTCFFLIGNQKVLDNIIKTRLIYSTYFAQGKKSFINRIDTDLGYTLGPDKVAGKYRTNRQSFRADREYSFLNENEHVLRIGTFGNSYVFCDGVKNNGTWQSFLEQSANNLEVLNFGVPGYGLGQSYLRYLKDGVRFNPDVILINYITQSNRDGINPKSFVSANNLRESHFYRVRFWMEDDLLLSQSVTPFQLFDPSFRKEFLYKPLGFSEEESFWSAEIFSVSNILLFIKQFSMRKILAEYTSKYKDNVTDEATNLAMLRSLLITAKKNGAVVLFFISKDFDDLPHYIRDFLNEYDENYVYINSTRKKIINWKELKSTGRLFKLINYFLL